MDKINYTEDNVAPWQGRAVDFYDKDDLGKVKAIRFYGNGSESGTPVAPYFYIGSSTRMYIPKCTFKRYGYLFTGWNSMPDGSGRSYKENAAAVNPPEKLYAQWRQSRITVNFVFPGGTMEKYGNTYTDSGKLSYTFSSASAPAWTLPSTGEMSKPYYKFLAWYKEEDFSGKPIIQIALNDAKDMTLYAKWVIDPNHAHEWENGECTLCHKKCDHSNFRLEGEKEATCKEDGFSGNKICSDCGFEIEKGHTISKTDNHKWNEGLVTKEPSCKGEGEILYTCTVCGTTKVDTLAKTDTHQFGDWSVDTPSSCTTHGKEIRTCKICGEPESQALPLAPHKPVKEEDKAATCTEDGYVGGEYCSVCKTTIKERTPIHATGHDPELKNQKNSTCTTHGYSGDEVCKVCKITISKGNELPLAPHTPKKEEGVPATCTQDGYTGDTECSVCHTIIEEGKPISKLGHDWANEKGECTRCGETHKHSFGEGTTITELTCTQDKEIDYTCSECGYVKKEITKATGHNYVLSDEKKADCTHEGYTGDRKCSKCDDVQKGKVIPATGHQWGEWETTLAKTCTTDGEQVRKCSQCSETETKTLKATGHTPETVGAKPATCQKEGYTGDEKCKVCHEILTEGTTIPKTQHSWDNGVITKAPSCTATGIKTFTCDNCGATKTVALAKLPMPKAGTKYVVSGNTYVVTRIGAEVRFSKANNRAKAIAIPSTIKVKEITYKVTSIGANAFKNCKKLTTVTIGANVKSIAAKAFTNCPKLKKVTIKTALLTKKTAGKKSFSKVNKKMVIKVSKKVKKTYAMILLA